VVDLSSFVRKSALHENTFRRTVQVLAGRYAPRQSVQQRAAQGREPHGLLVNDQLLMPKWL
jgi:hypothetical protein